MTYPFFFTWASQENAAPLDIRGGEGPHFTTGDGAEWLDLGSLIFQANLGHGHPRMIQAIKSQADRLALSYPSAVYPEKIALAEKLLAHAPKGFTKVFFTLGGSDATENAIKIARMATGKYKLISRYRSYHGATMGAVTLSGDYRRPPVEPGLMGVVHVDDFGDMPKQGAMVTDETAGVPLTRIPRTIEFEGPETVAAVFLESVVGANGVLIPPPGYLKQVRGACDAHGVLLVMDEVLAGFGRTGKWFGFEHWAGVTPDLITVGKALTAGYGTLGAVLVHERVAAHFEKNVLHAGLTFYAHPIAVAAGLEALTIYEEQNLVAAAAKLETPLREELTAIRNAFPKVVLENRVIGLLSGTDLALSPDQWARFDKALKKRHVMIHVRPKVGAFMLSPPLIIDEATLRAGVRSVGEALGEALS